ncbi:MAG TPA: PAS domain S-box protein [Steroidobacteraceae bacterium]|jgi:PAS domain S-box-containing protein
MPIRDLLRTPELLSDPLLLLASDGTIDTPSYSFVEQIGLPEDALTGRRLDALAAASASAIQEFVRACAQSTHVVRGSLLLRRRAETIALQARGVAYPPREAPIASHVLLRLVTESETLSQAASAAQSQASHWREVEDSLRRQSQILEVTLASIGDAVIVTDSAGRVTFLNAVAEQLTGWSNQSARSQPLENIFAVVNERTRAPVVDPVAKVIETGSIVGLANHSVLLARDGREIPIDDSAAPIRLPGGRLFGVVLIFRDITEQRRAEHTRAWLAAIIASSDDAIVSKTLDGQITSWNPGAVRLFGYQPEEILGKSILEIVPPELHDEEAEVLARLRRGERVEHFETTRIAKDGRRVEVSLTVSPIRDEEGTIVGASKIARDIGERKRAERLLREAERRKDEFLAVLAHELRNPLAPLRNALELLSRGSRESHRQMACEIMDRQLRQMTRLVDDLLDLSRITAGRIELQIEAIDMRELLGTVEASLKPVFDASQQQLTLTSPPEPLHVLGDRVRLLQVFANLFQNANKYTPRDGSIRVDLQGDGAEVVVRVVDDGIGIPPNMLEKVFDLFTQVDPSDWRARTGLGIGLTLARSLVELHGGTIQALSSGRDAGSEFVVRLPARLAAIETQPATAAHLIERSRRVLIADDNEDAAVSLSMLLDSMGHETKVVHDGMAAFEEAETFQPEVMIVDIDMPKLNGYQVAQMVRSRPWAKGVLVIAMTGWAQESERERGRRAGFHAHLVKPVTLDALQAAIAEAEAMSEGPFTPRNNVPER